MDADRARAARRKAFDTIHIGLIAVTVYMSISLWAFVLRHPHADYPLIWMITDAILWN